MTTHNPAALEQLEELVFDMPTEDEMKAAAERWYAPLRGIGLDELPQDVMALSAPTRFMDIPEGVVEEILADRREGRSEMNAFASEIDDFLNWDHALPKLQTRSPKDSWDANAPFTVAGRQVLDWFAGSMRVFDDLAKMRYLPNVTPKLCLRQPLPLDNHFGEFRCFVKDGLLIAVSAYDYRNANQAKVVADNSVRIRNEIDEFFNNKLKSALDKKDYVFDVAFMGPSLVLIEINPYGLSDPCWFETYDEVEKARHFVQTEAPTART